MYEIGNDFNKVIKDFSTAANKAFTYLQQSIFAYLAALCIIDLALPILIGGMVISRQQLITKIMKYAGLMGILLCWQQFTDNIVLNFITSVAGTYNGGLDEISANMSQPQLLLQHGIRMIAPGLNKAASFTTYEFVNNISTVLTLYVFTFLVMGAFIFLRPVRHHGLYRVLRLSLSLHGHRPICSLAHDPVLARRQRWPYDFLRPQTTVAVYHDWLLCDMH